MLTNHKRSKDPGEYGPSPVNKEFYDSHPHHRKNATSRSKDKTNWIIDEGQEYSVFILAEDMDAYCKDNKCLFGIVDDGKVILGKNGQRLAKFWIHHPNVPRRWHGYPVFSREKGSLISEELLDRLQDKGRISYTTKRRIERRDL